MRGVLIVDESSIMRSGYAYTGYYMNKWRSGGFRVFGVNEIDGVKDYEKIEVIGGYMPRGRSMFVEGVKKILDGFTVKELTDSVVILVSGQGDTTGDKKGLRLKIRELKDYGTNVMFFGTSVGALKFAERLGIKKSNTGLFLPDRCDLLLKRLYFDITGKSL